MPEPAEKPRDVVDMLLARHYGNLYASAEDVLEDMANVVEAYECFTIAAFLRDLARRREWPKGASR